MDVIDSLIRYNLVAICYRMSCKFGIFIDQPIDRIDESNNYMVVPDIAIARILK